ncbi:MAG: hypothetical protein WCG15_04330 [Actinomycetes bacterium]
MMAISQAKRTELHQELREKLTVDTADTLMDHLPPDGWSEVAMKSDIAGLRTETKSQFAEVKAEFTIVNAAIESLKTSMNEKIELVEERIKREIAEMLVKQNRWTLGLMTSLVVAMIVALIH